MQHGQRSPRSYLRLRETWLSRKPDSSSFYIATTSTSALLLGSLLFWHNILNASQWMPASYESVYQNGELWRLWTTVFAHADLGHLVSNSFLFFILGYFLFGYFGTLVFPLAGLVAGALANAVVLLTYPPQVQLIGASGVVYWMGGTWLVLYFFLSRQKNLFHRSMRTLGVALLLFAPSGALERKEDVEAALRTSHLTHFAGFMLGLAFGFIFYFANRRKFLAAEVFEEIIEEDDFDDPDGDALPPPEGFPVKNSPTNT